MAAAAAARQAAGEVGAQLGVDVTSVSGLCEERVDLAHARREAERHLALDVILHATHVRHCQLQHLSLLQLRASRCRRRRLLLLHSTRTQLDASQSLTVARPAIPLTASSLLLVGHLIGSLTSSTALALLVVRRHLVNRKRTQFCRLGWPTKLVVTATFLEGSNN